MSTRFGSSCQISPFPDRFFHLRKQYGVYIMALMKCTLLFQFTATDANKADGTRSAGWSESYYYPTVDFDRAINVTRQLSSARAGPLATGGNIIGQRYQIVDPVGPSRSSSMGYTGGSGLVADIPQMALYCRARASGSTNARELVLRGIPDARVVGGTYSPSQDFERRVDIFFAALRNGWVMRGRDMNQQRSPIVSIATDGVVTTTISHGLAAGDRVQVLRTTLPNGRQAGGVYTVLEPVTSRTFKIATTIALPTTGGSARKALVVTPSYGDISVDRIGTRKVGRVFFPYRGRATVKR